MSNKCASVKFGLLLPVATCLLTACAGQTTFWMQPRPISEELLKPLPTDFQYPTSVGWEKAWEDTAGKLGACYISYEVLRQAVLSRQVEND